MLGLRLGLRSAFGVGWVAWEDLWVGLSLGWLAATQTFQAHLLTQSRYLAAVASNSCVVIATRISHRSGHALAAAGGNGARECRQQRRFTRAAWPEHSE